MNWKTKVTAQKFLERVPYGSALYDFVLERAGGLRKFKVESKLDQGIKLFEVFSGAGNSLRGLTSVEIGTGWVPVIPILFWFLGQKEGHTFDSVKHLSSSKLVNKEIEKLTGLFESSAFMKRVQTMPASYQDTRILREKIRDNRSIIKTMEALNIQYHAPRNFINTGLPDQCADLIYSVNVLEHVPQDCLDRIFIESGRILREGGHVLHRVDLSDHYAHSDASLHPVNFLRFSENEFNRLNNSFCYQNRWRVSQYKTLAERNGFEITAWLPEQTLSEDSVKEILPLLNSDFQAFPQNEIAVTGVTFLVKKGRK